MFRKITGPAGSIDTVFGTTRVRTTQLGFPAEITSAYNSTTGYSWKRLYLNLATPGFDNPSVQQQGSYAFEVTGSTGVASGTRVWMEPDPDVRGHVFAAGAASATYDYTAGNVGAVDLLATYAAGVYEPTGIQIALPSAGTYLVDAACTATGSVSSFLVPPLVANVWAGVSDDPTPRLGLGTMSNTDPNPAQVMCVVSVPVVNVRAVGTASMRLTVVVTAAKTLYLMATRDAGGVWTWARAGSAAGLVTGGTSINSAGYLSYLKIA